MRSSHWILSALGGIAAIYLILLGALFVLMHQPPEKFARAMARVPGPAFLLFPFRTLWLSAREGPLRVGDEAPDFRLPLVDGSAQVLLSSFRGQKPVVLVFGSYT